MDNLWTTFDKAVWKGICECREGWPRVFCRFREEVAGGRGRKKDLDNMEQSKAIETWSAACDLLRKVFTQDTYDSWIGAIHARGDELGEGTLTLAVPNGFYQDWLKEHYLRSIKEALGSCCEGGAPALEFVVDGATLEEASGETAASESASAAASGTAGEGSASRKAAGRKRSLLIGEPLDARNTFDTFVVGPSNTFAHAAALAVVDKPGCTYNPLFIYGGTGLGKTHLIQAMGHAFLAAGKGTVCYTTSEIFTNEYIAALRTNDTAAFRKKYRNVDLLLIDDIHFLANKTSTQEEFFHTFNALYQAQKQIVLTSDRPLGEIAGLEKRLVSRFEWGLTAEMEMADLETRVAILKAKSDRLGYRVDDEAIFFIAEHVQSNIRKLEGSLLRVASYASLTSKPHLTTENLEFLLRETIEQEHQTVLTIEAIQRTVAEHYDIRLGDMTSKQRPQAIAFPRQVAMYLCREMTDQSLPSIGHAFGRNHATVLHAYRTVAEKMRTDANLRQTVLALQQRLGGRR